jgi:hypothetical protein
MKASDGQADRYFTVVSLGQMGTRQGQNGGVKKKEARLRSVCLAPCQRARERLVLALSLMHNLRFIHQFTRIRRILRRMTTAMIIHGSALSMIAQSLLADFLGPCWKSAATIATIPIVRRNAYTAK